MSSIMCLAMCRTEEQIGIPEITINGSCSIFLNQMHQLVGADWKYVLYVQLNLLSY